MVGGPGSQDCKPAGVHQLLIPAFRGSFLNASDEFCDVFHICRASGLSCVQFDCIELMPAMIILSISLFKEGFRNPNLPGGEVLTILENILEPLVNFIGGHAVHV